MDYLESGIYTVPEAARLLEAPSQKIRGWVAGYKRTRSNPIIKTQIEKSGRTVAMSFLNLMEARFIKKFSDKGIHLISLRAMAEEAKDFLKSEHPFATNAIFRTDGKKIFAECVEKYQPNTRVLYDLKSRNWSSYEILGKGLIENVKYDPNGLAESWVPRPDISNRIVLHRKIAFGQPVLKGSWVPTRALYDALSGEGETEESIAKWYQVTKRDVQDAVRFETEIH